MTQRMFHESGQDGRSVLGMVAIQVERDPKTGSSVIRSVAPMSAPADAALATTVFDDGRKSVHTFGATEGQPSAEELGQILSAVDGVGMKVLLDEVTVTPPRGKISTEIVEERGTPEEKKAEALSYFTHPAVPQQNKGPVQVSMTHDPGAEPESVDCRHKDKDEQKGGDAGVMLQGMRKLDNVDERVAESRMEEGPITLRFLGYADALSGQGEGQGVCLGLEDNGDVLTVERVIITDEGEEKSVTPPSSASPAATSVFGPGCHTSSQDLKDSVVSNGDRNIDNDLNLRGEAGKESKVEEFQNIPLDENGAKPQGEEGDNGLDNPASPSEAPAADKSKQKTCQCCTVM
ncbi:uncharacterized protein LOC130120080 [Lampris incognitus]|uniref:uncharacterized protein LOC130120080 n=1 Tax=Lampris incognitus TaxID=2546036 RepID=UPI0024B60E31|nr:uncharacterized protein LOC130120080 [Lampris incognitus]